MSANKGARVERIRIVLIGMPRMLREIIGEIVRQDGRIEIAGEYRDARDVVTALSHEVPGGAGAERAAGTVAIVNDGHGALLLQRVAPRRLELDDVSPVRLLAAIVATAAGASTAAPERAERQQGAHQCQY
jgi:hypothetical protein